MRDTTLEGRAARDRSRTHKEQKAGWASRRGVLPAVIIVIAAAGIADTAGAETFS